MEGTKPNLVQMVLRWPWSPSKIIPVDPINYPRWQAQLTM